MAWVEGVFATSASMRWSSSLVRSMRAPRAVRLSSFIRAPLSRRSRCEHNWSRQSPYDPYRSVVSRSKNFLSVGNVCNTHAVDTMDRAPTVIRRPVVLLQEDDQTKGEAMRFEIMRLDDVDGTARGQHRRGRRLRQPDRAAGRRDRASASASARPTPRPRNPARSPAYDGDSEPPYGTDAVRGRCVCPRAGAPVGRLRRPGSPG